MVVAQRKQGDKTMGRNTKEQIYNQLRFEWLEELERCWQRWPSTDNFVEHDSAWNKIFTKYENEIDGPLAGSVFNSLHSQGLVQSIEYEKGKIAMQITEKGRDYIKELRTKTRKRDMISILFLASDPTDLSRLRLGEEFREIQENLKKAKLRDRFKLELPQLSTRPSDITQALLDIQPQIVHFSGHGMATGALCFENQVGESHLVQPDVLAALFKRFANQVNCVLLNACYAEKQAKAIAHHINCVVGMSQAISDIAAIAFTVGFYQALGAGRKVEEAYELGCVQIMLQNITEHLTPVMIKKGEV